MCGETVSTVPFSTNLHLDFLRFRRSIYLLQCNTSILGVLRSLRVTLFTACGSACDSLNQTNSTQACVRRTTPDSWSGRRHSKFVTSHAGEQHSSRRVFGELDHSRTFRIPFVQLYSYVDYDQHGSLFLHPSIAKTWRELCHEYLPNPKHATLREKLLHLEDIHRSTICTRFPPREGSFAAEEQARQ